jgi:hypothetical protein
MIRKFVCVSKADIEIKRFTRHMLINDILAQLSRSEIKGKFYVEYILAQDTRIYTTALFYFKDGIKYGEVYPYGYQNCYQNSNLLS